MGGVNLATCRNDVWSSDDGTNWAQATSAADWPARYAFPALAYDGKMWILGGFGNGGSFKHDVWSSTNGVNWTQATSSAAWSNRSVHAAVVHNNKMWILGGYNASSDVLDDIWNSTNGIDWIQITPSDMWSARKGHKAVSFKGRIWVFGGDDLTNALNDVWSSADGTTWARSGALIPWIGRQSASVAVFGNRIYLAGGETSSGASPGQLCGDVWTSTDGHTWSLLTGSASWSPRSAASLLVHNGKLWIVGGDGNIDVWCSSGGAMPIGGFYPFQKPRTPNPVAIGIAPPLLNPPTLIARTSHKPLYGMRQIPLAHNGKPPYTGPTWDKTVVGCNEEMTIIRTIWYVCGLMIVATLLLSAMTVVPAAEANRKIVCVVSLGLAVLLAIAGRRMAKRLKSNPTDAFLTSTTWSRAFVTAAVVLTLAMFSTIA